MATMAENVVAAGKENGEMLLDLIKNGPVKLLDEITVKDVEGVNDIVLDIYTLINHYQTGKEIWDRVKELMEGTEMTKQEQAKQARDLHSVNFDQLYAFLKHNERDAKEVREMQQVKYSEWFKDKMILAQAQEAGVVLNDEQQDFLADSLEETDDYEISKNNRLRAQLKGKFSKNQINHNGTSVKTKLSRPPTSGNKLYLVTLLPKSKVIYKVVEKNDISKSVPSHLNTKKIIKTCTKVITPGLLKTEPEPINAYFKNNKVMHRDYLKVTKEHVATLHELLEEARALKPLDGHIGHASKFAEQIQELLVYVSASCPFTQSGNEKAVYPIVYSVVIGRVCSTNASGSQPRSNTENDRIPQPSSRSKKNKVEAQPRKFKSSANKNNHVSDYLEVAFRKHTCFVQNLEGVDLLSGSRCSNLYTISMAEMMKSSPIYLLSKASKTKSCYGTVDSLT
ncbi:hypothetical protein Tco_0355858 [Tanacetum coccineum]